MEGTHVVGTHSLARDITENQQIQTLQQAVYRIAAAAESTRSLDELYPQIHQIISSVMPAENFYITLYEEAENLLRFPYYKDSVRSTRGGGPARQGLSSYVLRTGKSLLCTQAVHDELERLGEIKLLGAPSAIWLGVPLLFAGKTIGVMVVQHYTDPKAYGEREQHMLEFVSTQVAIAIDRKRAEEQVIASELRYRRLFEAARDGILILDAETGVVKDVNPFLVEMLGIRAEEIIGKELWELGFSRTLLQTRPTSRNCNSKGTYATKTCRWRPGVGGNSRWSLSATYTRLTITRLSNATSVTLPSASGQRKHYRRVKNVSGHSWNTVWKKSA